MERPAPRARPARSMLALALVSALVALASGESRPHTVAAATAFNFNWNGKPGAPMPWTPGTINDWDLMVESRDNQNGFNDTPAQHGADCSAYPATHMISTFEQAAFICNNHLMTSIDAPGYGEVIMTPAQMIDFSGGATFQVSVSTMRTNDRDLLGFNITPFQDNLVYPIDPGPDGQGMPKDGIEIEEGGIPTYFNVTVFHDFQATEYLAFEHNGRAIEDCVGAAGISASRRDVHRITLSRSHLTMQLIVNGAPCTLVDQDIVDPGFSKGVVQLEHHNYTPVKAMSDNCGSSCVHGTPLTWHWSDFSISNPVPFTILRGDAPLAGATPSRPTVTFPRPAPANSYLRFAGFSGRGSVKISANGGAPIPAVEQPQNGPQNDGSIDEYHHISYWTPIPAGTTSVTFSASSNWSGQPFAMQDVAIWSSTETQGPPVGTVPSQSPSPSASPSPSPSASPTPSQGVPTLTPTAPAKVPGKSSGLSRRQQLALIAAAVVILILAGLVVYLIIRRRRRRPN